MSEAIKRMLRERHDAQEAEAVGLRRELVRRLVETRKKRFVAMFERQTRFYRARSNRGPKLTVDALVECEAAELAADPGWDAERAWKFSETRQGCLDEVEAELRRRVDTPGTDR